ncbi:MAG: methylated-DNA--[protein]-cysteine S-methyltransferase [Chitinophagaceae bacterium]|nr:methylated-DNA--[protein]-cysteine S-methyltransferase [Chitinophagaceae bacterium]
METLSAYYQSPIGVILISTSEDVVTEILFINSYKGIKINEAEIDFSLPKSAVIKKCIKQLDEYFSGQRKIFDLPLQHTGTVFQKEVWNELINIPYGKHISYLTLSKRIENVRAIRAVGAANGCNKICIVVPCHRVIGSNGDLVGYGGDLWRKKWLLDHEAKFAHGVQKLF